MCETKLTGKRRHRVKKTIFGNDMLVLQVQVSGTRTYCVGSYVETDDVTYWRDARVEDLSVESQAKETISISSEPSIDIGDRLKEVFDMEDRFKIKKYVLKIGTKEPRRQCTVRAWDEKEAKEKCRIEMNKRLEKKGQKPPAEYEMEIVEVANG